MDFKSLSLFMQTSLAYECTLCKLYFGTENQLLAHHKRSHSKRLKVSLNPQLNLVEDEDYIASCGEDETLLISANSIKNGGNIQALNEEHGIAKLEDNGAGKGSASSTTDSNDGSVDDIKSQNDQEPLDSSKGPLKRTVSASAGKDKDLNLDEVGVESPLKRVKTESDNANQEDADGNAREGSSSDVDKRNDFEQECHRQYSDSMKDTIEHGQYGYLTDSGFHHFSLEELKKFAVQVVALFKLDESHQYSKSLPIPVIQNDITGSSTFEFQDIQSAASTEGTGNALDDPNKSCYKCGEPGHFAWGCTNPRNREIQPKRKRRGKTKKKGQDEEGVN